MVERDQTMKLNRKYTGRQVTTLDNMYNAHGTREKWPTAMTHYEVENVYTPESNVVNIVLWIGGLPVIGLIVWGIVYILTHAL